ncbi:hypothetical protein ARSEF1564_009858 [Beauveria bassiana]
MEKPLGSSYTRALLAGGSRRATFLRRLIAFFIFVVVLAAVSLHTNPSRVRFGNVRGPWSGSGQQHPPARGHEATLATVPTAAERRLMEAAGNRTLGFSSIQFINMPGRFDRSDAATLQAHMAGIDYVEVTGVTSEAIKDVGMPPEHTTYLKPGEKGCWRAHANIWNQMLRDQSPAVLVLESDAGWDLEIRDIMSRASHQFTYLLHKYDSKPLPSPDYEKRRQTHALSSASSAPPLVLNPDDPWHSTHWDLLSVGQCWEDEKRGDESITYPDPSVAPGMDFYGRPLGAERVLRRSGGIVCTTAYAISQTGAAKLLLRGAVDLDAPVDLIMRQMIEDEDLIAYSFMPTPFAQWAYVDNIGMKSRGSNSDIHGKDDGGEDMSGWDRVRESHSVWWVRGGQPHTAFTNFALEKAWSVILPNGTLRAGA